MKYLIASDIHGNVENTKIIIKNFEKENCNKFLFLGDFLAYDSYFSDSTDELADVLNPYKSIILAVEGNCDYGSFENTFGFKLENPSLNLFLGNKTIYATHGHIYDEFRLPEGFSSDILIHGHSHIPAYKKFPKFTYINPGSVGIPRGGSKAGFIIAENNTYIWKTIKGETLREVTIE